MIVRRLVLLVSIAFCGSLALAAGAVAAGGGGLAPGQYTFNDVSANAFFGGKGGPPAPTFSIFVNRGLNSFEPSDGHGEGQGTVTQSTMVQLQETDASGFSSFGCFVIPDGDFVVAGNLQSASLHTTLTATDICPGAGSPVGGAPQPGPKAATGGGGLTLPISVNLKWSGANVISTSHDRFSMRCLDLTETGANTFRDSLGGSASGSIDTSTGLSSQSADVSAQTGSLDIQGAAQPPCFGK